MEDKKAIPKYPNLNQSKRVYKDFGEITRALISDNQASWDENEKKEVKIRKQKKVTYKFCKNMTSIL